MMVTLTNSKNKNPPSSKISKGQLQHTRAPWKHKGTPGCSAVAQHWPLLERAPVISRWHPQWKQSVSSTHRTGPLRSP